MSSQEAPSWEQQDRQWQGLGQETLDSIFGKSGQNPNKSERPLLRLSLGQLEDDIFSDFSTPEPAPSPIAPAFLMLDIPMADDLWLPDHNADADRRPSISHDVEVCTQRSIWEMNGYGEVGAEPSWMPGLPEEVSGLEHTYSPQPELSLSVPDSIMASLDEHTGSDSIPGSNTPDVDAAMSGPPDGSMELELEELLLRLSGGSPEFASPIASPQRDRDLPPIIDGDEDAFAELARLFEAYSLR